MARSVASFYTPKCRKKHLLNLKLSFFVVSLSHQLKHLAHLFSTGTLVAEQLGVRRYQSVVAEEKEFSKTGRENMKLTTITVESRQRGLAFISQRFWISMERKTP